MTGLIIEAVLVAFCVGGVVGAIISMQLQIGRAKKADDLNVDHRHVPK